MRRPLRHRESRFTLGIFGLLLFAGGCEPEMPQPPLTESKNPAEKSFNWAMERLEHALEKFRSASSLGLSVKRDLDYQLIPPKDDSANYTARVTISVKAVYRPEAPPSQRERAESEAKKDPKELKLDNPYRIPGEAKEIEGIPIPEIPPAEVAKIDVPDPRLPTQKIEEKKDYLLEYIGDAWKLTTTEIEQHERMWFDYALEQGEFAPVNEAAD